MSGSVFIVAAGTAPRIVDKLALPGGRVDEVAVEARATGLLQVTGQRAGVVVEVQEGHAPHVEDAGFHFAQALDLAQLAQQRQQGLQGGFVRMGGGERKSFKDVKSYKRRKRWLA